MKPKFIAANRNRNCVPSVRIEVWHHGLGDYRVAFEAVGEYRSYETIAEASAAALRLAFLPADSLRSCMNAASTTESMQ